MVRGGGVSVQESAFVLGVERAKEGSWSAFQHNRAQSEAVFLLELLRPVIKKKGLSSIFATFGSPQTKFDVRYDGALVSAATFFASAEAEVNSSCKRENQRDGRND